MTFREWLGSRLLGTYAAADTLAEGYIRGWDAAISSATREFSQRFRSTPLKGESYQVWYEKQEESEGS